MGHSRADKEQSHQRILDAAAQAVRRDGAAALGVADIMRSAGLTHGAFYSHFASRADLVDAAIAHALSLGEARHAQRAPTTPQDMARGYLSREHRDQPETGCALAALSGESAREPAARQRLFTAVSRYVEVMQARLNDDDPERGWSIWAMLVGTLTLARLAEDDAAVEAILAAGIAGIDRIAAPDPRKG